MAMGWKVLGTGGVPGGRGGHLRVHQHVRGVVFDGLEGADGPPELDRATDDGGDDVEQGEAAGEQLKITSVYGLGYRLEWKGAE